MALIVIDNAMTRSEGESPTLTNTAVVFAAGGVVVGELPPPPHPTKAQAASTTRVMSVAHRNEQPFTSDFFIDSFF